ncbi:MAG TPA: alkaline phosphatase D family protein [Methylomirabilota bacterium]
MLAVGVAASAALAQGNLLIAAGDVTSTTAVLWTRGVRPGEVTIDLAPAEGATASRRLSLGVRGDNDLTGKVRVTELTAATRYRYRVSQDGAAAEGEFVTSPAPTDPGRVRFLWSGDLGGGGLCRPAQGGFTIFPTMLRYPADFFLFVGDTAYTDVPCSKPGAAPGAAFKALTLPEYRARHRHNREDAGFQTFLRRMSVYAIWDDHEVRNDFAGSVEPLMPIGRQAFLDYWPIIPPDEEPGRLYRRVRWGRLVELFILDTRQYRSENTRPDGPGKTMLGAAQRRWLIDAVTSSTATWKIIVSSVTLSVPTGRPERRDGWSSANVLGFPQEGAGFATERDEILRAFRRRDVRNLVFIAADVHHAELIRHHPHLEWSFHEFIAGPLSAGLGRPRPIDIGLNPRSLFARGGVFNFGEVTIEPSLLTVRLIDETDSVMFSHTIGVE